MTRKLTHNQINAISRQQVFTLGQKIQKGEFSIESVGDYLPGNVLVTDLNSLSTAYMNKNGCNVLKHNVEELAAQGPEYFQHFFVPHEINQVVSTYLDMHREQDASRIYTFVHRVKPLDATQYKWYFAAARLLFTPGQPVSDKVMLIVNEVDSLGSIARKINNVLEESDWMKKNFKKFCLLTRREKEIINLVASGKSSSEIADLLLLSKFTVKTHRRNIATKLETSSFAYLHKFAVTFGLVTP